MDTDPDLSLSLSKCSIVISFISTVLVYALYLKKLPIRIYGIMDYKEFPSKHEEVSINNWKHDLKNALSKKNEY